MASNSTQGVYFKNLYLNDVRCFKGDKHKIDLSDGNGKPAMWTVILGNNNTGKTTLLRCLADLEPIEREENSRNQIQDDPYFQFDSLFYQKNLKTNRESKEHLLPGKAKKLANGGTQYPFSWGADLFVKENTSEDSSYHSLDSIAYNRFIHHPQPNSLRKSFLDWFGLIVHRDDLPHLRSLFLCGYGTNRRMSQTALSENDLASATQSLFDQDTELLNVEEWLLQVDYAAKNKNPLAQGRLNKIKSLLTSNIFPDIEDFRFITTENLRNYVEVKTPYGWVPIRELGYGYQASIAWLGDLARRMFERYPDSEHPFREPAIVLIDEIDLHLHPEWQRKIVGFLSSLFPRIQFIVTAHSPMIVQSAEEVNVVLLEKKEKEGVHIRQDDLRTFKGWTVEEILQELMGMGERTHSDVYLSLMQQFEEGLDEDNYIKVQEAYEELEKILHPTSAQRKLLKLQMAPLISG